MKTDKQKLNISVKLNILKLKESYKNSLEDFKKKISLQRY
jgi:hypothetical protein